MLSLSFKKNPATTMAATFLSALIATSAVPVSKSQAGKKYGGYYNSWEYTNSQNHQSRKHKRRKRNKNRHNNNGGDLFAVGIIGLAIGAIIADSANTRRQRVDNLYFQLPAHAPPMQVITYPQPIYDAYGYSYGSNTTLPGQIPNSYDAYGTSSTIYANDPANDPKVINYDEAMAGTLPEPWTSEWYSYCRAKFGSFSDETGTYRGFDNRRHFCVPK